MQGKHYANKMHRVCSLSLINALTALSMVCHKHQLLQGMTPLHYAAFDDFCKLGKLLLACGADRAAEDNEVCRLECHINTYTIAACKLQE